MYTLYNFASNNSFLIISSSFKDKEKLLANAFCLNCEEPEFADDYIIEECGDGGLIIKGNCKYCNEPLSRIVEKEWWEK